jgi:hypothetical protein
VGNCSLKNPGIPGHSDFSHFHCGISSWLHIIGSAAGVSRLGSGARQRKPNILLILGDDLGLTDVGRYGGKLIRTQRGSLQGGKTPLRVRLSTMQRGWYLSGMIS